MSSERPVPFRFRMRQLLDERPDLKKCWIADQADISASLFSKILHGTRPASPSALKALSSALEIPLGDLVAGTDAEEKLTTPRSAEDPDFRGAVSTVIAQERTINDLQAQVRALKDALGEQRKATKDAEQDARNARSSVDLSAVEMLTKRFDVRKKELAHVCELLAQAAADFAQLKTKGEELENELRKTSASPKTLQFLAAFNALGDTTFAKLFDTDSLFDTDFEMARRVPDASILKSLLSIFS
jgi:transcriptional regulator with XRE-family HTH domain